jgi:hypothetical protein
MPAQREKSVVVIAFPLSGGGISARHPMTTLCWPVLAVSRAPRSSAKRCDDRCSSHVDLGRRCQSKTQLTRRGTPPIRVFQAAPLISRWIRFDITGEKRRRAYPAYTIKELGTASDRPSNFCRGVRQ